MVLDFLNKVPEGYSEGIYEGKKYGLTKTTFNDGKSIKFYGDELGGNNFVSLNYYITRSKELLKMGITNLKKIAKEKAIVGLSKYKKSNIQDLVEVIINIEFN